MATYSTKQGDTWDGVAYSQLGSEAYTDALMNANVKHLHYFTFPAGIELTLPEIEDEVNSDLPPWKQG